MRRINVSNSPVALLTAFLLCSVWLTPAIYAQGGAAQNRSTISGFVFNNERRPVSQMFVELLSEYNSVIQRVRTDGSGRFFFSGLPGGRFYIRVLTLGTNFEEQTQEVEVVTFGGLGRPTTDNVQKDIYLRLRRDASGISNQVTGSIFAQEIPVEARKAYEKAVSDLGDSKTEAAGVAGLQTAINIFPTYYLALEKFGSVLLNQQKYEAARDVFSRAVAVNERGFYSWYGLGFANYFLKQSNAAVEAARKAVLLNAQSPDALLFLGVSLRQAKQYEEAEKQMKQAGKLAGGKLPDVYWNLALLYAHNLKRYKDAADQLEGYLKASPDATNAESIKKLIKQFREKAVIN